jgi:hypothetical protein
MSRLTSMGRGPSGSVLVSPFAKDDPKHAALLLFHADKQRLAVPRSLFGRAPLVLWQWSEELDAFVFVNDQGKVFVVPRETVLGYPRVPLR